MTDCLFCKISDRKVDAEIVYQDDEVIAFNDIHPKAPHHVLIIPRKHIATINDISVNDTNIMGQLLQTAKKIALKLNIANNGYRLIFNCNNDGGQEIYHIHLHLLGGCKLPTM
jgi:histidine triad (HIT) family protein